MSWLGLTWRISDFHFMTTGFEGVPNWWRISLLLFTIALSQSLVASYLIISDFMTGFTILLGTYSFVLRWDDEADLKEEKEATACPWTVMTAIWCHQNLLEGVQACFKMYQEMVHFARNSACFNWRMEMQINTVEPKLQKEKLYTTHYLHLINIDVTSHLYSYYLLVASCLHLSWLICYWHLYLHAWHYYLLTTCLHAVWPS